MRPPVLGNRHDDGPISDGGVPVLVVQVREELQLARECLRALAEDVEPESYPTAL